MLIFLLAQLVNSAFAQKPKLDFCRMLQEDQSHYCDDDSTHEDSCKKQNKIRMEVFKKNFRAIIACTKQYGFPNEKNYKDDTCVHGLTLITFIHIAQTYPAMLFNRTTINLLKKELERKNLNDTILHTAILFYTHVGNPTIQCKSMVELALKEWKIDLTKEYQAGKIGEIKYFETPKKRFLSN